MRYSALSPDLLEFRLCDDSSGNLVSGYFGNSELSTVWGYFLQYRVLMALPAANVVLYIEPAGAAWCTVDVSVDVAPAAEAADVDGAVSVDGAAGFDTLAPIF